MNDSSGLRVRIHRGTHEIGGSCVEVRSGKTSIFLDMGMPLKDAARVDLDIPSDLAGVVISHPHQDHFGLITQLDRGVPVYMGQLGHRLIDAVRVFTRQSPYSNRFQHMEPWKPFTVGDLKITPQLVDHSTPEAFSLVVEGGGKRIFYTGDFRRHGRKGKLFENFLKSPIQDVDVMLMEGTMLGRSTENVITEGDVEETILDVLNRQRGLTFIMCSSQNVDRMVSAYRACKRANKTMIVDFLTAWVLEQMRLVSDSVPRIGWPGIRTYATHDRNQTLQMNAAYFGPFRNDVYGYRIKQDEIEADPSHYLFLVQASKSRFIESFAHGSATAVIYSLWDGYLKCSEDEFRGADALRRIRDSENIEFIHAHCSGHAYLHDLKALVGAIKPRAILPIHTEFPEDYARHFSNVVQLEDGQWFRCA